MIPTESDLILKKRFNGWSTFKLLLQELFDLSVDY
jgi:hypothetical protein